MLRTITTSTFAASFICTAALAGGGAQIFSDNAADADGLAGVVNAYRDALGQLNAPNAGSVGTTGEGRRQIDWDAAPTAVSAPNDFPGDFFNFCAFPRARGVVFTTDGYAFQLSSTAQEQSDNGTTVEFGNVASGLDNIFATFSPERLFTPLGSNQLEVSFKVPGKDLDALATGFGAVFTDVDLADTTSMEFYDYAGNSLGLWYVEAGAGWANDETLSFLGVKWDEPIVARVVITAGTKPIDQGDEDLGDDLVVMDDFIFGEPVPANPVAGDADLNGLINAADLASLLAQWGTCSGCVEDINGDGWVDYQDLAILLAAFDTCP